MKQLYYTLMPYKDLNSEQMQAIAHTEGPLLIVAGAGTGKTTVITQKITRLITENKVKPEEILALTFTEKAAFEMLTRVEEALGESYSDLQISTFHAFCQRILEAHGLDIGLPTPFKLVTELQAWFLVKEAFKSFDLKYYRPLANPTRHIHEFIKHFSKCKDELISPEAYLAYAERLALDHDQEKAEIRSRTLELANAYHRYERLLLEHASLDFGDLIFYAVKLLEDRPSIRAKLGRRFKYILVDEFQDVNYAQYRLVQLLAGSAKHLTVVGDDDQSIYAFRGASVANILHFKDDFPAAQAIVLNQNYRSVQPILDASYQVIQQNNPDRLEAKLSINKQLISHSTAPTDRAVNIMITATAEEEVRAVVDQLLALKNEQPDFIWDDVALLSRATSHAEPFIEAFRRQNIPFVTTSATSLYHEPIVMDALAFFQATLNNHDPHALFRLLHLKLLNFSDHDLQTVFFSAKKKSISYLETLKRAAEFHLSYDAQTHAERLVSWILHGTAKARTAKPTEVLYAFLEESGYLAYLAHEDTHGNGSITLTIEALTRFYEHLTVYEDNHPTKATVAEFLEFHQNLLEAGDEGDSGTHPEASGGVQIMTVHASKGLEFKYVFVVNVVEERFPVRRRTEALEVPPELIKEAPSTGDAHYQEERRLFYVAATRAKHRLYITAAKNYGGSREKKISRFIKEMGYDEAGHATATVPSALAALTKKGGVPEDSAQKAPTYDIGTTFSFSQLRSYETCPYQYKLNYVLKIPTKGSPHFSFGQSMHLTLQKFYERVQELNKARQVSLFASLEPEQTTNTYPSLEELQKLYDSCWIDDWYQSADQREEYYKKGKEIIATVYREHEKNARIPLMLEGWFKIAVGNYFLNGRIDRIDRLPDGTLEIIDYKTGQAKDKLSSEDKEQLLIYQIAAEQVPEYRHQGTTSKLTFYYLNDNVKISFLGTAEELSGLKEKLVEIIDRIRAQDFTPAPSSFICGHCDFRSICEFRAS